MRAAAIGKGSLKYLYQLEDRYDSSLTTRKLASLLHQITEKDKFLSQEQRNRNNVELEDSERENNADSDSLFEYYILSPNEDKDCIDCAFFSSFEKLQEKFKLLNQY
jgi:hypothetical protein